MDNLEQEKYQKPAKLSPFADSPYESAYIEENDEVQEYLPEKPRKKRGFKIWLVILLVVVCAGAAAFGVDCLWQARFDRMEQALEERLDVLQQQIGQKPQSPSVQAPSQEGALTPGEVYSKNVDAVVMVYAQRETANGYSKNSGSGFLITADGYVVTNYHVIESATRVSVVLHNGEELVAQVKGHESTNDIALLKVEGENLPFATLGSSDALQVGDQVAAIGNPLGELTATLTVGYVSAKDRIVDTDGTVINMIQTDAAINAGNSGGPLFNMYGQVVGITTAKYSGNSDSGASIEGLGFAIPTDDITGILEDLKEFGYVTGAYLGVMVRDVDASAQSYGLPAGAYVEEVTAGFAAEEAGIRAKDIIVELGGYEIDSLTALTRALRRLDPEQTVSVTVYRNGQLEYLTITLDEKPVEQAEKPSSPNTEATIPEENPFEDWFSNIFPPFFGN